MLEPVDAKLQLTDHYRAYIACLNARDWTNLGRFIADDAKHNGRPFGLAGYRAMLEQDFRAIPDLHFNIVLLAVDRKSHFPPPRSSSAR